jgi:tetratricopeptide (TPR) repeat protein
MNQILSAVLALSLVASISPALGQAIPLSTDSAEAREIFERGRLAAFHYRFKHARAQLEAASAADPEFALVYIYRGGSSYDDREARRRHFDRAIELGVGATEAERRMITAFDTFLWHGDHAGAVEIFKSLAEDYPDDYIVPAHIGLRYLNALDDPEAAILWFRRANEIAPDFAPAQNWLGLALFKTGRNDEAQAVLDDSLARHAEDPYTHDFIAKIYLDLERPADAARLLRRALAIDPDFEYARAHLLEAEAALSPDVLEFVNGMID